MTPLPSGGGPPGGGPAGPCFGAAFALSGGNVAARSSACGGAAPLATMADNSINEGSVSGRGSGTGSVGTVSVPSAHIGPDDAGEGFPISPIAPGALAGATAGSSPPITFGGDDHGSPSQAALVASGGVAAAAVAAP